MPCGKVQLNRDTLCNTTDSEKRIINVIISGLSEEDIMYNDTMLPTDAEKMTYLFQIMG